MERILLCISYSGKRFNGFQLQQDVRTVQGVLENAITAIYGYPIRIHAAGRTDTAVHALRQYVHFDITTKSPIPIERLYMLLNSKLDADIRVEYSRKVDEDFHSRYSAIKRTYCYSMYPCITLPAPYSDITVGVPLLMNWKLFLQEAKKCIGTHDFALFTVGVDQQTSTIRSIHDVALIYREPFFHFYISANGFLWKMVRNIVGFLIRKASQKRCHVSIQDVLSTSSALYALQKKKFITPAQPQGLYLYEVQYKHEYGLLYRSIPLE